MKKFDVVVNGYDKEEVKLFVKEVTVEYENCLGKLIDSQRENAELREKLIYYEQLEKELLAAKSSLSDGGLSLKKLALKEADSIIRLANEKASLVINEALNQKEKLEQEFQELKTSFDDYKKKVSQVYNEQKKLIDMSKFEDNE